MDDGLITSHQLARWLLQNPDLPVAYRGPPWCPGLPASVTRAFRAAVGTPDSLVERLNLIVIEADPDRQLKEIPREQPSAPRENQ